MSAPEVCHRLGEQVKKSVARHHNYDWSHFTNTGPAPALPFFRDQIVAHASEPLKAALRDYVEQFLAGHLQLHGVVWPQCDPADLFPQSLWRLDPVTGGQWPGAEKYCFDIPYRSERRLGDVKYVWDANRLQFLQPLAVAVALDEDVRALAAIERAIESWCAANPPFRGLAWSCGIELALRAITLIFTASLCSDRLRPQTHDKLRNMLSAHLHWLCRYPSKYSSANNHLVMEEAAKFVIALALGAPAVSPSVRESARAALEREAQKQILADGVGAEQSPTYGAFTAEALLLAARAGEAQGIAFSKNYYERLAAFADHIAWLANSSGGVPLIGDDDEGRVLTMGGRGEPRYPASVAAAICGALRRPQAAPLVDCEIRNALFGASVRAAAAPQGLRVFGDGGYTIVRETRAGRKLFLAIDHGPLGYLSIAAHGHADANSMVLSLDDQPILVDPGTYLYHSGGAWRDWFRSTRAHNTLAMEDADQSVMSGPFNWSHKARACLDEAKGGDDWRIVASHDGYAARFGVMHRRTVSPTARGLVILDALTPERTCVTARIVFQFAADAQVRLQDDRFVIALSGRDVARLKIGAPGETRLQSGEDRYDGGWISPRFGEKCAAPRLEWRGIVPAGGVTTMIDWTPREDKV